MIGYRAQTFFGVLDQRANVAATSTKHFAAKPMNRIDGIDLGSSPPTDAPKWCISETWLKTKQHNDSEST